MMNLPLQQEGITGVIELVAGKVIKNQGRKSF
jgi:hypothetical protein